jgi:hypothetical protein
VYLLTCDQQHHIFINPEGFHNHIVHHLLTLYGLGASTFQIERAYKDNTNYQRPTGTLEERIVQDMSDPAQFKKYLGKEKYYKDFLVFFQTEMEKEGWEKTLQEYMFAGNELADDIFGRMHAGTSTSSTKPLSPSLLIVSGFLHPIIHLGFGVEFKQPAIICEALAQACIHDTWTSKYLFAVEDALNSNPSNSNKTKTIPQLLTDIRADQKLSTAAHWNDGKQNPRRNPRPRPLRNAPLRHTMDILPLLPLLPSRRNDKQLHLFHSIGTATS